MSISLTLHMEPGRVEVAAGGEATARVVVRHSGGQPAQPAQVTLRLVNAPAWASLPADQVGVFPGEAARLALRLQPPADTALAAYAVGVEAQDSRAATGGAAERDTLEVVVVAAAPLATVPPALATGPTVALRVTPDFQEFQTETTLTVEAEAQGAVEPVTVRLQARDDQGVCWFTFAPPELVIPVGGRATAEVGVRARDGAPHSRDTRGVIAALPQDGATPLAEAVVNLRLEPILPPVVEVLRPEPGPTDIAQFTVRIANSARAGASFRLRGLDDSGALQFSFIPSVVAVPGRGQAVARLTVTPREVNKGSQPVERAFRVRAESVGGTLPPGEGQASFPQTPIVKPVIALEALPPPLRLRQQDDETLIIFPTRRPQGSFQLPIQNPSPYPVTAELRQVGDRPAVRLTFAPTILNLPPNATAFTQVTMQTLEPMGQGERWRRLPFGIEVFAPLGDSSVQEGRVVQEAPPGLPNFWLWWTRAWQSLRSLRHGLVYLAFIALAVPLLLVCLLPVSFTLNLVAPLRTATVTPTPTATPTATATPTRTAVPAPPTGPPPAGGAAPPAGQPAAPSGPALVPTPTRVPP